MPVCTEDLDKANSRSHWNIRWCGENKCGTKREHRSSVNYIQRRDISAVLSTGYLAYGVGGQQTTFTSCQNAACSNDFFLQWVDGRGYIMAEEMCIIFTACFILRGRDTH